MEILKWAWWLMPTVTKLGKLREEDCYKFKANLDYISNSKWKIKNKKQESFMNSWWYRMEITSTINYLSFKYIYIYIHIYIHIYMYIYNEYMISAPSAECFFVSLLSWCVYVHIDVHTVLNDVDWNWQY